ncbi:MAG: ATP synthase subunit I [Clostridiaceae bacterium]|nr:ATP synthase subunit I [Clostridiaceae bacterium]
MKELIKLKLSVYKYTFIIALIVGAVSFFIVSDFKAFVYGLVFGTLIAVLNFNLLSNTMEKAAQMPSERAQRYASSKYYIRFAIYGIVLYISIIAPYINVIGTIIGLLTIKLVILILYAFNDKNYYKKVFKRKKNNDGE